MWEHSCFLEDRSVIEVIFVARRVLLTIDLRSGPGEVKVRCALLTVDGDLEVDRATIIHELSRLKRLTIEFDICLLQ